MGAVSRAEFCELKGILSSTNSARLFVKVSVRLPIADGDAEKFDSRLFTFLFGGFSVELRSRPFQNGLISSP